MTQLEFLLHRKAWALKILGTPETMLPGTLTHAKAGEVLEATEDELHGHVGIYATTTGWQACYVD